MVFEKKVEENDWHCLYNVILYNQEKGTVNESKREQWMKVGEKLFNIEFPNDVFPKVWSVSFLWKRYYIKKEGEVRWQMKNHSCICCQCWIVCRLYRDECVVRDWCRSIECTKKIIKNVHLKNFDTRRKRLSCKRLSYIISVICYLNWQHMFFQFNAMTVLNFRQNSLYIYAE